MLVLGDRRFLLGVLRPQREKFARKLDELDLRLPEVAKEHRPVESRARGCNPRYGEHFRLHAGKCADDEVAFLGVALFCGYVRRASDGIVCGGDGNLIVSLPLIAVGGRCEELPVCILGFQVIVLDFDNGRLLVQSGACGSQCSGDRSAGDNSTSALNKGCLDLRLKGFAKDKTDMRVET